MNVLDSILTTGAKQLKVPLSRSQTTRLLHYLQLLLAWGQTYNLSAVVKPTEAVKKHLLDCLAITPYISGKPLLDIGSGAGLPGIVLAITKPELSVSVIDSVGKKCRFMRFVKTQLKLKNLSVINARVEQFKPTHCFTQITSRAFASVEKTLALSNHLLCDNGEYLLMKGVNFAQESLPPATKIHRLTVPYITAERYLLAISKK